jgi:hypothetical protein
VDTSGSFVKIILFVNSTNMVGRKAIPHHPTKFMNSKRRVIHMTAEGKYVAMTDGGKKIYNPKAHYVKSPGGTVRVAHNSNARIPTKIRKVAARKPRSNRGKARGAYAGVRAGALAALYSPKAKRGRGRPRKYLVSPGGNMGLAKLFGGMPVRKARKRHEGLPIPRKRKAKDPLARLIASLN